jgi:Protein of unknown function (DUF2568)
VGSAWNALWLTVAFLSEVAALAVLAWWGWTATDLPLLRVVLAIGAPLLAAVLWGSFAAPKARIRVPLLAVLVKVLVFGAAVLALLSLGHPVLAVGLLVAGALGAVLPTHPEVSSPPPA